MKKVISAELQPEMIIAEAIFSLDNKQILIPAGSKLTEKSIRMINNWNISFVLIAEDEGLQQEETSVPEPERVVVLTEIMAQKTADFLNNYEEATSRVGGLLEDIRDQGFVELTPFREVAVQVAKHLIQPAEAINKMLFKVPPPYGS